MCFGYCIESIICSLPSSPHLRSLHIFIIPAHFTLLSLPPSDIYVQPEYHDASTQINPHNPSMAVGKIALAAGRSDEFIAQHQAGSGEIWPYHSSYCITGALLHHSPQLLFTSLPQSTPIMLAMEVSIIDNAAGAATTSSTKIWPNPC